MESLIKTRLSALATQGGKALFVVALGVTLLIAFLVSNTSSETEKVEERRLVVSSQEIKVLPGYHVDRYFSAQVESQQSVAVASEISGKVVEVYVDDGDPVSRGQALFKLDTQLLMQQKTALLAQQDTISIDKVLAEKRLKRQNDLKQKSFSSEDTIDALESQISRLSASLKNLQAQTQDIEIRMSKSEIYAPFTGQIQKRHIDIGAVISAGMVILDLIDSEQLEIQVGLPVSVAKKIELKNEYYFVQEGELIASKALAVLPKIDPITQTQGVKFSVAKNSGLVPGDYVKLKIRSYQQGNGFWLANSALVEGERGLWQIFVIDQNGWATKQSVSIIYPGNPRSYVTANLQTGSKVITKGVHRLSNRAAIIEQNNAPSSPDTKELEDDSEKTRSGNK